MIIILVPVVVIALLFYFAPEGYEDENGFHFGKK